MYNNKTINTKKQKITWQISLLTMYEVLLGLILNRITPYTKYIIGNYQHFMIGKFIIDHIFTVKQLVEKHYEFY